MRKLSFFLTSLHLLSTLSAASGTWTLDADGNWNDSTHWSASPFPDGSSEVASFLNATSADRIVTLGQPITIGSIVFDGAHSYTIASATDHLTINGTVSTATTSADKPYTISAPIILTATVQLDNETTMPLSIQGSIAGLGSAGLQIGGPGPTVLSGTTANTYIGNTLLTPGSHLILQKTAGVAAISGAFVQVDGALLELGASDQIGNTTIAVILSSNSTFNMAGFSDTINALSIGDNCLFSSGGGTLTLTAFSNALILSGTNPVASGSIALTASVGRIFATGITGVGTISGGTLDLGGVNREITVDTGATLLISSTILNGSVAKDGTGTLTLQAANTYLGGTTISQGTIKLGVVNGLPSSGVVNLSVNGASLDLNGFSPTINDLIGAFNTTITSSTAGSVTLTTGSSTDRFFDGVIQDGSGTVSLFKQGSATLTLGGANTYTGGTTAAAGTLQGDTTSLQGNILNTSNLVFNQTSNGTYAGSLSGTGTLDKQGAGILTLSNTNSSGAATVSAGTLSVNGTLAGGNALTVAAGTTLQGTGTITKDCTINGVLSPGNSIGTIFLVGNQILATGSTLFIELSPAQADLVSITGALTIQQPGSTLSVNPMFGIYPASASYTIVHTTGGITGMFSTITSSLPLFRFSINETMTDIMIIINAGFMPFSSLIHTGNAGKVAQCLDALSTKPCSNLSSVIATLQFIPTESGLKEALLQLQPSAFTSLAIAQENDIVYIKNTIYNRLERQFCCCPQERKNRKSITFWTSGLGAHTSQKSSHQEPGFIANSPGAFVGVDSRCAKNAWVGGGAGYTHTHLNWREHRGSANMQTAYASLYGQWNAPRAFVQSSLIGGYNFYKVKREMAFGQESPVQETAFSSHQGLEGSFNFKTGFKFKSKAVLVPFLGFNYIFVHEDGFQEKGAQSLNLKVKPKNSDLLVSEAGLDLSRCILAKGNKYTPFIRASIIRESRFHGEKEIASFNCGCEMSVKGFYPSRTLGNVAVGLCSVFSDNNITVSYEGKFSKNYNDQAGYVQYLRRF